MSNEGQFEEISANEFNEYMSELNEYISGLELQNEDLIKHVNELKKRIAELERQLQESTDQNDLILDEFVRVKCLTDNTEIHQLCERAHLRMRQKVPVIKRNHRMERLIKKITRQITEKSELTCYDEVRDFCEELLKQLRKGGE